ncbi:MAG: RluA family pseudouridine synthase [Clostridia bacterium]|nr:RluA family pseudouridine synthase [Clostridia bacterium]
MKIKYKVKENDKFNSVNSVLDNQFKISTRLRTKLIKNKLIMKNGNVCDSRENVKIGDIITINLDYEEESENIVPTQMELEIIFEDEWLLVVNKPAGIPVHPSILHYEDSLSNGIKYYYNSIGLKKKIRPVNRLDKNTSGLVIFAKCEYIQERLTEQMQEGTFKKQYLALVSGILENKKGTINLPIARKQGSIIERCIDENGKTSITHYEVLKEYDDYSLVKCTLETGRTHQIRVHFSAIGHSLLGDELYGKASKLIDRQALHCYYLEFIHPVKHNITICKI